MKKFILIFSAIMMMQSCAVTSGDTAVTQEGEAYKEDISYHLTFPIELFEVADVVVTYAGNNGALITETITQDQTIPLLEYNGVAYRPQIADSTYVIWEKWLTVDSIPARAFISPRLLAKTCADEYKDKRYTMVGYMGFLYDSGREVSKEQDPDPNDSIVPHQIYGPNPLYGKDGTFFYCIDVSGSKMGSFIDIANDDIQPLDCTIRPEKPGSKKLHAEYNND